MGGSAIGTFPSASNVTTPLESTVAGPEETLKLTGRLKTGCLTPVEVAKASRLKGRVVLNFCRYDFKLYSLIIFHDRMNNYQLLASRKSWVITRITGL